MNSNEQIPSSTDPTYHTAGGSTELAEGMACSPQVRNQHQLFCVKLLLIPLGESCLRRKTPFELNTFLYKLPPIDLQQNKVVLVWGFFELCLEFKSTY